jgi:hypothetical protein
VHWVRFTTPAPPSIDVWHQRLAHTSVKKIRKVASLEMVDGLILPNHDVSVNQPCPGSMCGKMQSSKFKLGRTRATQIGQLVHSDVCGPMHMATPRGSKYFVLFTDDFSGYRTVYFLKQKSEVADSFKDYVNILRTETGQPVHTLRADNGGEFTGLNLKNGYPPMVSDWRHQHHTPQRRMEFRNELTGLLWKVLDASSMLKVFHWSYGEKPSPIRPCSLYTESCIHKNSSEHPLSKLVWFEAGCLQPSHLRIHCVHSCAKSGKKKASF